MKITGAGKLYLNMSGDIRHTLECRGDGGQIVAFDISQEYRDAVRSDALPQNKDDHIDGDAFTRQEWKQLLKEYPEIWDPTKGADLMGYPISCWETSGRPSFPDPDESFRKVDSHLDDA
ncbi:hypothetical protein [Streptomyces orinoci]|uniref:Uncharacterized protein n=1 Tax=Streptomyces orinoci TaxID=67339 RepID=A0ABV3JX24_STRON|nr:hypothetical protein [Streptomyces orinoci]